MFQVTRGRDQLDEARRTYEILNTELHDELPALHDSRILFLVTNLQTLFATEQVFHNETAKVCMDTLSMHILIIQHSPKTEAARLAKWRGSVSQ